MPNKIAVEGHTDRLPYGRDSYTNWELSADAPTRRAGCCRRPALQLSSWTDVRGFADTRLRLPGQANGLAEIAVFQIVVRGSRCGNGSRELIRAATGP